MIPVKIISKVEIPTIKEEVISELIKMEILRNNPELTINSVVFERKLNPQSIQAVVEAQLTASIDVNDTNVVDIQEPVQEEVTIKVDDVTEKAKRKKVFG
jgi:hypothetical protein